jgi:hypothetical protein
MNPSEITFTGEVEIGRKVAPLEFRWGLLSGLCNLDIRSIFAEWMVDALPAYRLSRRDVCHGLSAIHLPDQSRIGVKSRAFLSTVEAGEGRWHLKIA